MLWENGEMRRMRWLAAGLAALWGAGAQAADPDYAALARAQGTPEIAGLTMVWLAPWGDPARAHRWQNIIVHQTEGGPGSAREGARQQALQPRRRGVTVWVETDGTVFWAVPENEVPLHGDGANRNDNRYIDNTQTYRRVTGETAIGVEFAGNYPDVGAPPSGAQIAAWDILVRVLQARYRVASDRIYAHNWIDFKDARYCEGCLLAQRARALGFTPGP